MGVVGVVCAVVGLVGAGLVRWLPVRGRTDGLAATGVAGVRGGVRAALVVAVVELHAEGTVDVDPRGRLRRVVHSSPGRGLTPLHRAVWAVLGRPLSAADVAVAPGVRRAQGEARADLAGRGLRCGPVRAGVARVLALAAGGTAVAVAVNGAVAVGLPLAVASVVVVCAPARTPAGYRVLRAMRREHPLPEAGPVEPEDVGLLVALYGRRAVRRLVPQFAARGGLLGGRAARETVARTSGDLYDGDTHEGSGLSGNWSSSD
ncbi:TIGR04222 domain-containing membrane protein [Kitasatospora sp. NPDC101183]|uniref:TIGR04222 domain-containing membrane protein n=1 Tax=Kitasatospora sp. NPDC101183 TaxID=3364100 RepID=UPI0037F10869